MKLAVIDHIGNPGGGSRVLRALLPAMMRARPGLDITFFGNLHSIKREQIDELIPSLGIKVKRLSSVKLGGKDLFNIRGSRHVIQLFQRKYARVLFPFSYYLSGEVHKELEAVVKGFDLAFFTWPFHLKCPALSCPMAGIFHDFAFKYYFSGGTMAPWVLEFLNREMPRWLQHSTPIVSTDFMRTELEKFYPGFGKKTKVVPVAPTSVLFPLSEEDAKKIVSNRFQIHKKYLLCPTNISSHKNTGPLLAALPLLKQKGHDLQLVFVGSGTEIIRGKACATGLEIDSEPKDVLGLGYVSNQEIDALIQCASVVVNPSLYEGGNVPGFDAWARGVPVAMSRIPTFEEHLRVHDVRATLFDPRSPEDIAAKLDMQLKEFHKTQEDAIYSQAAIGHFTWERTAQGYLEIFDEILQMENRKTLEAIVSSQ